MKREMRECSGKEGDEGRPSDELRLEVRKMRSGSRDCSRPGLAGGE